ncbi:MAG: glycosyl hydrolase family 18 protein, partial [Mycobacterium leprae]
VPPTLRPDYTAFITELYGAMKQVGLGLTLSVPAKTEDIPESPWTGAFDYAALAPYADKIVIMTYDEHLPGFPAGPIASIPWVNQVMAYVVTQIPHDKVLLGVAAYAYNWVQGTTTGIAQSVPNALNLVAQYHATIQWDPAAMVPFFTYTNSSGQNRIVYFENAQSTAAKLAIMRKYDLGGIAIWRLGLEEPGIWPVVAQQINR